jgi:hypothetical protein
MAPIRTKKQFLAQFNRGESQLLCKHRGFTFLLDFNVAQAAFLAATLLNRCVFYPLSGQFDPEPVQRQRRKVSSKKIRGLTLKTRLTLEFGKSKEI